MNQPDDPERLAASSELSELFRSAARDVPSDEQLARLAAALGPMLGGAPGAPRGSSGASPLLKWAIATGTVALLVGGGLMLRRSAEPAPGSPALTQHVAVPSAVAVPARVPAASSPPAEAGPAASANDVPSARLDQSSAASPKPSAAAVKALSEAALLEQARRALNSSPSYALQLANQHRARFPNGVLSQEREVIAIEALRRLHRTAEADQRAASFSQAFPGSAHQRMVGEAAPK